MSIDKFLSSIPDKGQALNDFYSIKQIEHHHNFKTGNDDSLLHVLPLGTARSVILTNPREHSSPMPVLNTLKLELPPNKPKLRFIFLASRYVKVHPLNLNFWKDLMTLPLILFQLERRLINIDFSLMYNISVPNVGESMFWKALQTRSADLTDNYETLETLGDSVLKLIVSLILYS